MTNYQKIKQMIMKQKVTNKTSKFIKKNTPKNKGQKQRKQVIKTKRYQIMNTNNK